METHEGEAPRVNRFLNRSWKIHIFGCLKDFASSFALRELFHVQLLASFLWWLLFRHNDLRLLLGDGVKVSRSYAGTRQFHVGVIIVVV